MRLLHKRILILFSVALNVGFVIMALIVVHKHFISSHERTWQADIVQRLDLPSSQSQAVLDSMRQFRTIIDGLDQDLKRARGDIIGLLVRNGPVDREQLHRLVVAANDIEKRKSEIFEAHALALRQLLGNENGARFFSLLKQHIESSGEKHPR